MIECDDGSFYEEDCSEFTEIKLPDTENLDTEALTLFVQKNLKVTWDGELDNPGHFCSYVVKKIDLEFCTPAKLEDTLIIKNNAVLASKARIQFIQSAINQKNDTLICKGLVEVCYFDSIKNKPKAFPDSLLALFR